MSQCPKLWRDKTKQKLLSLSCHSNNTDKTKTHTKFKRTFILIRQMQNMCKFSLKTRSMLHGCMVCTEHAKTAAVSSGTNHVTTKQQL